MLIQKKQTVCGAVAFFKMRRDLLIKLFLFLSNFKVNFATIILKEKKMFRRKIS